VWKPVDLSDFGSTVTEMEEALPQTGSRKKPADAWVHPDDLVDDRALNDGDQDQFRLMDVVEEVASVCGSTAVPATLALYGSWGSGKSSLANLLERWFADDRNVAFARFDAFKYAEVPLRRHFLSQVAEEFGVKDRKFSEGLYTSKKDVRLHIPAYKWIAVLAIVLTAVALTTFLAAAAAFVIALVSKGDLWSNFAKTLRASVTGVALATPFLATALAIVGKTLTAETTIEAPSSDEQFEALFQDLVKATLKQTKRKRLVIFIDELDRCSPPQVVTALETLRTFLEVEPCVFVVAADRQVLEHALTEAARQATPLDSANPYYSAGSAYLDKIFQYQLQLPPILPRRLSRYALGLIENRRGVWSRVRNQPELVSVLVPTHVRSPRRVKALLNSFALLYRLALKRAANGPLDADVEARAAEVAKLACLRTEFPLFAADLQLDARLPDLVLRLRETPNGDVAAVYHGLSAEAIERAKAYAQEKLPVDEVIAEPVAAVASPIGPEAPTTADVEMSHAKQLIRYLEKTREIASPGRDLIYLESLGAAFGLASELAEKLEGDAVDGKHEAVVAAVAALDETEQQNAYRLLSRLVVEAVGIEARNVAQSLFGAIAVRKGDLAPVADDLLNALVTYNSGYELEADDLSGALMLALSHEGAAAFRMREVVLARDELLEDNALALQALEDLDRLGPHQERLAATLAGLLEREQGVEAERAIRDASDARSTALVEAVPLEDDVVIRGLQDFIESAQSNERGEVAFAAFRKLAMSDEGAVADVVAALVSSFAPITDRDLAASIAAMARSRPVAEWATWLDALDLETAKTLGKMDTALDRYVEGVWSERTAPTSGIPVEDEVFADAARAIGRVRPDGHPEDRDNVDLVSGLGVAATTADATTRAQQYSDLWVFSDSRALDDDEVADSILYDLARTLAAPQAASWPEPMAEHVFGAIRRALASGSEEAFARFASAGDVSPWLAPPAPAILRVEVACAHRVRSRDAEPPSDDTLRTLIADESTLAAVSALGQWIDVFEPEPRALYRLLLPRWQGGRAMPKELGNRIQQASEQWSPEQKSEVLQDAAAAYTDGQVHDSVIRGFGLSGADPDRASAILVRAYQATSNNEHRSRLLDLWQIVSPAGAKAERLLVDKVFVPMLKQGKGATRIALDHFSLVQNIPTNAARERLKRGFKGGASGAGDLAKRAERLLKKAGWISGKRKWLPW
jgi:hypothetical protein